MIVEREKWDEIYKSHLSHEVDPHIARFNTELVEAVQAILPSGASVAELGCGAAWQSLAMAQSRRYEVSALDFSDVALGVARDVFAHHGETASFRHANAFQPGDPEFDLVFNASVLEHYSFEEQAGFIRGMASRSRRYVLAVIPNSRCYWYWVWRLLVSGKGQWPYGREVPRCDLKDVFEAAGLQFGGLRYFARDSTELFITQTVTQPDVQDAILRVHRSTAVGDEHKCYLVGGIGVLPGYDGSWLGGLGWKPALGTPDLYAMSWGLRWWTARLRRSTYSPGLWS